MDIVQEWPKQEVRCYEWAVTKGEGNNQCNNSKDVRSSTVTGLLVRHYLNGNHQPSNVYRSAELPLRQQINCDQREQKVGNKHCRASIILRDSLPKKQRRDGCGGKNCPVERDR